MSNAIQIRLADKSDLQGVNVLEQACFPGHSYPDFFFRQALDCWPEGFLLACDDGTPLGYLLASAGAEPHLRWILSVAVSETQRGRGIGRKLLTKYLNRLPSSVTHVHLTVAPENSAKELYLKQGFVQTGYESDYFGDDAPRLLLTYVK
ncbi:GCN5-related N-acetyltransferase [Shewanella sediminis HAW-EB3]|uniref:GCN5-related N-acetyltransferase n=1 Tax=Shewanella sediminis (strain HAW-EB3) TaxID=425104 RepID=A8G1H3_SHESH|nr:N-acetyltransferase [Shewanella sediminis]ABV38946.1 GCN5-related N-acetyltransferase [Shewanella sediminis HAW-EB3]